MSRNLNLREQFNVDTKGYAHFNAYCRALMDKKPTERPATEEEMREALKHVRIEVAS